MKILNKGLLYSVPLSEDCFRIVVDRINHQTIEKKLYDIFST